MENTPLPPSVISLAIDVEATASLVIQRDEAVEPLTCHACNAPLPDGSEARGLFMWVRGDEVRFEEPALCDRCATAIGITALATWSVEEEEG